MIQSTFECYDKVVAAYVLPKREGAGSNSSAHVVLQDPKIADDILRGKYGFLAVPGNRHLVKTWDLKPLDAAFYHPRKR
jgi:hypothetical protein